LLIFSAQTLSDKESTFPKYILLLILAPLVTAIRYEGLFLGFVVSILFFCEREFGNRYV